MVCGIVKCSSVLTISGAINRVWWELLGVCSGFSWGSGDRLEPFCTLTSFKEGLMGVTGVFRRVYRVPVIV